MVHLIQNLFHIVFWFFLYMLRLNNPSLCQVVCLNCDEYGLQVMKNSNPVSQIVNIFLKISQKTVQKCSASKKDVLIQSILVCGSFTTYYCIGTAWHLKLGCFDGGLQLVYIFLAWVFIFLLTVLHRFSKGFFQSCQLVHLVQQ